MTIVPKTRSTVGAEA